MAKYLIEGTTLTSMANNVRTMAGSSDTMTANEMATKLRTTNENLNNEIINQTDLISQIQSTLEGKAAGGGSSGGGTPQMFFGIIQPDENGFFNIGFYPDIIIGEAISTDNIEQSYLAGELEYLTGNNSSLGLEALSKGTQVLGGFWYIKSEGIASQRLYDPYGSEATLFNLPMNIYDEDQTDNGFIVPCSQECLFANYIICAIKF